MINLTKTTILRCGPVGSELVCRVEDGLGQCMNGDCYDLQLRCNGVADCADGYDEAACEWTGLTDITFLVLR